MADLNSVCLIGRLTRQAEIRYSQAGGGAVVRFSIAVNRRKRSADGSGWEDEANFFDCVFFGRSAESINQYLEKGRQVSIVGELRQSRWEQDGASRSRVEIVVNQLNLIGGARQDGSPQGGGQFTSAPQQGQGGGYGQQNQQSARSAGGAQNYAPSNQNRYSGSFSRPGQGDGVPSDFSVGGPETYGDDDVPF